MCVLSSELLQSAACVDLCIVACGLMAQERNEWSDGNAVGDNLNFKYFPAKEGRGNICDGNRIPTYQTME